MAGLLTARMDFRFLLEIDGADAFAIQEVDLPEIELEEVQYGAPGNIPNRKAKEAWAPKNLKIG